MSTESTAGFRQAFPYWGIVVRLAGQYDDAGDPNPAVEDPTKPVGRVVLEIPDFVADALAHMIDTMWDLTEQLTDGNGPAIAADRNIAQALHDAVVSQPGYRCPQTSLTDADPEGTPAMCGSPPRSDDADAPADRPERALLRAIGKRIRLQRITCELSQGELARRAGMSRNFISTIERGQNGIDIVRLDRLAAALDTPLTDLLAPHPTPSQQQPAKPTPTASVDPSAVH